jgi:hypothetical protein
LDGGAVIELEIFMMRMVVLLCGMQLLGLAYSHAQSRDQVVVLALLGHEPGNKDVTDTKTQILASKRVDNQTIEVEVGSSSDHNSIIIREDPECIFSIGSKTVFYNRINFASELTIFQKENSVWMAGKDVSCSYLKGECFDFVPLSFLEIPARLNKKQLEAVRYLRSKYCNPAATVE